MKYLRFSNSDIKEQFVKDVKVSRISVQPSTVLKLNKLKLILNKPIKVILCEAIDAYYDSVKLNDGE